MICPGCGVHNTEYIRTVCAGYWELWKCRECTRQFYVQVKGFR
jgi:hypothetical protein